MDFLILIPLMAGLIFLVGMVVMAVTLFRILRGAAKGQGAIGIFPTEGEALNGTFQNVAMNGDSMHQMALQQHQSMHQMALQQHQSMHQTAVNARHQMFHM